jgi:hypothetical protein
MLRRLLININRNEALQRIPSPDFSSHPANSNLCSAGISVIYLRISQRLYNTLLELPRGYSVTFGHLPAVSYTLLAVSSRCLIALRAFSSNYRQILSNVLPFSSKELLFRFLKGTVSRDIYCRVLKEWFERSRPREEQLTVFEFFRIFSNFILKQFSLTRLM